MRKIVNEETTKKVYDRIAKTYNDSILTLFYNRCIEMPATLSLLKNIKGKRVLDLGCGAGRYEKALRRRGARVFGIDLSPKMIELARANNKNVEFRIGSVYDLPYKSNYFDIVIAALVVEYFDDLDRAFKEVNRVLKKEGTFIFSIHNPVFAVTHHIKGKNRMYRRFNDYFKEEPTLNRWSTLHVIVPHIRKTYQTWIRAIIQNNFSIEDYIDAKPVSMGKKINRKLYNETSKLPSFCVFKVRKLSPGVNSNKPTRTGHSD